MKSILDKFVEVGRKGSYSDEEFSELSVIGILIPYEITKLEGSVLFFENLIKGYRLINGSSGGSTNQTYNLIKKLEEKDKNKAIELFNWVAFNGGDYYIEENVTYDEKCKIDQEKERNYKEKLLNDQKIHLEAVARKKQKSNLHISKRNKKMPVEKLCKMAYRQYLKNPNMFMGGSMAKIKISFPGIHGFSHWEKVNSFGNKIADKNGADKTILYFFSVLHDYFRLNEDEDFGHGERVVNSCDCFPEYLSKEQVKILKFAVKNHNLSPKEMAKIDDLLSKNITVHTCLDADRLDLPRVGMSVDSNYLFTDEAKELIIF